MRQIWLSVDSYIRTAILVAKFEGEGEGGGGGGGGNGQEDFMKGRPGQSGSAGKACQPIPKCIRGLMR